jgi:hypothetical protein
MEKQAEEKSVSYKDWASKNKIRQSPQAQSDYDDAKEVYDNFEKAKMHRQNSCYWGTSSEDEADGQVTTDWNDWWNIQEKMWMGWWRERHNSGGFQSNVKSPMTTGRIESTVHKLEKLEMAWAALAGADEDQEKAKVANILLDTLFSKAGIKSALATVFKEVLIHGTAFARVFYQRDTREFSLPVSDVKELSDEDKLKVKEGKVIWGKKEKKIKYDDIVVQPIPIRDCYPEPYARGTHENYFSAKWWVYKRIVSIEDFKNEFGNNPNARNVSKVKGSAEYESNEDIPFYVGGALNLKDNVVVLLEYENELSDKHIITANGITVVSEPLPYVHKEITLHRFIAIEFPHEMYGIGIPDFLMNHQTAEELILNMIYDYVYRSIRVQYLIDSDVLGEVTQQDIEEDNQFIGVDPNGRPLSGLVHQMTNAPINFDVFKMLDITSRNATLATQIDPSQMSLIQKNVTATATAINKENTDSFVGSLLDHIGKAMAPMGRQIWALMQQKYSVPKVKKTIGEDGKHVDPKYRKIRIEGKQVVEEDTSILIKDYDGVSFFEVKPKYLSTSEDLDIRISPESLVVRSKGLEQQRAMEMFAQLMPFAVDPDNAQQMSIHPNPLFNAREVAKGYIKKMDVSDEILLDTATIKDYDLALAKEHIMSMFQGAVVAGTPGRSVTHTNYERDVLNAVEAEIANMDDAIKMFIEQTRAAMPPQIDPVSGMPIEAPVQIPQELERQRVDYEKISQMISDHLAMETAPFGSMPQLGGGTQMPQVPGMDGNLVPPSTPQGSGGAVPMPQDPAMTNLLPGLQQ